LHNEATHTILGHFCKVDFWDQGWAMLVNEIGFVFEHFAELFVGFDDFLFIFRFHQRFLQIGESLLEQWDPKIGQLSTSSLNTCLTDCALDS
jgi:hypothetical protein